jgi:hypothetical protein
MAVMDDETNTVTHRRDRKRGGEDLNVSQHRPMMIDSIVLFRCAMICLPVLVKVALYLKTVY